MDFLNSFLSQLEKSAPKQAWAKLQAAIKAQLNSLDQVRVLLGLSEDEKLRVVRAALENTEERLLWNVSTAALMSSLEGKMGSLSLSPKTGDKPPDEKKKQNRPSPSKARDESVIPDDALHLLLNTKGPYYPSLCKDANCVICRSAFCQTTITTCSRTRTVDCRAHRHVRFFPHLGTTLYSVLRGLHQDGGAWHENKKATNNLAKLRPQCMLESSASSQTPRSTPRRDSSSEPLPSQSPTYDPHSPELKRKRTLPSGSSSSREPTPARVTDWAEVENGQDASLMTIDEQQDLHQLEREVATAAASTDPSSVLNAINANI